MRCVIGNYPHRDQSIFRKHKTHRLVIIREWI
jgi:hypothetical protein